MPRSARALALTLALSLMAPADAADWPRFHGPNGAGVADPDTPVEWTKATSHWKVAIPGSGHSSPVVVNGKVFIQSASNDAAKRTLFCLDAVTGAVKWSRDVTGSNGHIHKKNSLASSTPAVADRQVFAIFWDGTGCELRAYDLDGKEQWKVPLGEFVSDHGAGLSPMAHNGKVFVNYDQGADKDKPGSAELIALDASNGGVVWTAARKGFRACSATPIVRQLADGKAELVVTSTAGVTGYDPDTGKVNWDWTWKFTGLALRTIAGPLLAKDGTVVAFSGDGAGGRSAVAITPGSSPRLLWEKKKATPYVPSPVLKGDHLYWATDDGQVTCAEVKTGNAVWTERVFAKGVTASLIVAGDKVLGIAEDGKAVVFSASPEGFDKLAEMNLGEPVYASPAAADGRLFVRGFEHLYCFSAK
jgi:outer membrane protein assembly factor BamB